MNLNIFKLKNLLNESVLLTSTQELVKYVYFYNYDKTYA